MWSSLLRPSRRCFLHRSLQPDPGRKRRLPRLLPAPTVQARRMKNPSALGSLSRRSAKAGARTGFLPRFVKCFQAETFRFSGMAMSLRLVTSLPALCAGVLLPDPGTRPQSLGPTTALPARRRGPPAPPPGRPQSAAPPITQVAVRKVALQVAAALVRRVSPEQQGQFPEPFQRRRRFLLRGQDRRLARTSPPHRRRLPSRAA